MTWIVANTAVALVLSVLALAVGRWLKPAPAIMHGLWLLVLLKLVTPPLFEVPVDLSWLAGAGASAGANAPEPVVVPIELTQLETMTMPPVERSPAATPVAVSPSPSPVPFAWLWWIWARKIESGYSRGTAPETLDCAPSSKSFLRSTTAVLVASWNRRRCPTPQSRIATRTWRTV